MASNSSGVTRASVVRMSYLPSRVVGGVLHLQPELQVALLGSPGGLAAVDDGAVDTVVADEVVGVNDAVVPLRCLLQHSLRVVLRNGPHAFLVGATRTRR